MSFVEDYPALPGPLITASRYMTPPTWRRNDVMSGPPRYETITDNRPTVFTVTFSYSSAQLDTFETWYVTDLLKGLKTFYIDIRGPGSLAFHVNFNGAYNVVSDGKRFLVSAELIGVSI